MVGGTSHQPLVLHLEALRPGLERGGEGGDDLRVGNGGRRDVLAADRQQRRVALEALAAYADLALGEDRIVVRRRGNHLLHDRLPKRLHVEVPQLDRER